jgi:phage-related baseplate assembly protein
MATVTVTLASLLTVPTAAEALASVQDTYTQLRLRVSSWSSMGLGSAVTNHMARVAREVSVSVRNIAASGLLDTATGEWLTLLAASAYGRVRTPAGYTQGRLKITVASGASPLVIATTDSRYVRAPASGKRYLILNETGSNITIGAGSSDYVDIKAESPGDSYNLAEDTITEWLSGESGITITNDGAETSPVEWIEELGVDEESDDALRQACADRWATLSANPPAEAYRGVAIDASSLITRAYVDATNPAGAGTVAIYLAGPSGVVTATEVTAAETAIAAMKGLCAIVSVASAVEESCALTGTVYVEDGYELATVEAAVEEALDTYFAALPIGGDEMSGTSKIWNALIVKAIQAVDGVALAQLTSGDFSMDPTDVATVDYSAIVFASA